MKKNLPAWKSLPIFLFLILLAPILYGKEEVKIPEMKLKTRNLPDSGIAIKELDLSMVFTKLVNIPEKDITDYVLSCQGQKIKSQFIPKTSMFKGVFVLKFSPEQVALSRHKPLLLDLKPVIDRNRQTSRINQIKKVKEFRFVGSDAIIDMTTIKEGGFPSRIEYKKTKKVFDKFYFWDRVYHKDVSGWDIRCDKDPQLEILSDGPLCTVIRQSARFSHSDNTVPESNPKAVYQWYFFKESSLVHVSADYSQSDCKQFPWAELHFMEFRPIEGFQTWLGQDPAKINEFRYDDKSNTFSKIAGFTDGSNTILLAGKHPAIYDSKEGRGTYAIIDSGFAWTTWDSKENSNRGWLWIGTLEGSPQEKMDKMAEITDFLQPVFMRLILPEYEEKCDNWKKAAAIAVLLDNPDLTQDEFHRIPTLVSGRQTGRFLAMESKELGLLFGLNRQSNDRYGLSLLSLIDKRTNSSLLAKEHSSLFTFNVKNLTVKPNEKIQVDEIEKLVSDNDWRKLDVSVKNNMVEFVFQGYLPTPQLTDFQVRLSIQCDPNKKGVDFEMEYHFNSRIYSVMNFSYPSLVFRTMEDGMKGFYPTGPGIVIPYPVETRTSHRQNYPTGFGATMAWMAIWDNTGNGLYYGIHDDQATQKYLVFQTNRQGTGLEMSGDYVAQNKTLPANSWKIPSVTHLEGIEGDWYDGALIYRDWVRKNAKWYPQLGSEGRMDTPRWMKSLPVWCLGGGPEPDKVPAQIKEFKQAFGVPGGLHWYNWHQIPFDNDYPHFLPARKGFKEAVLEIQKEGDFHVMPYINGRLWDSRDKEMDDYQFTSVALKGVSKKEDGSPCLESYSSKEKDGSKVQLGAMCPTTPVWQNKVHENVLRIMNEEGVDGVYIDQVAASATTFCMDPNHGHPLGGGNWWCPGYWTMLKRIRTDMKQEVDDYPLCAEEKQLFVNNPDLLKNRILTTECNQEPYIHIFDGYLTWHWQFPNSVPAFSAVYGGTIQLFGRSYAGNTMAWRMKAAESLVYGEQLGWWDWSIIKDPQKMVYIKPLVRFRYHNAPYFYKGEMARPVKMLDPIPSITEDWQWSGQPTLITTDVIRTGTWRILDYAMTQQGKTKTLSTLLIFTNMTDKTVKSRIKISLVELGFQESNIQVRKVDSEGKRSELPASILSDIIEFPPLETWGIEISRKN